MEFQRFRINTQDGYCIQVFYPQSLRIPVIVFNPVKTIHLFFEKQTEIRPHAKQNTFEKRPVSHSFISLRTHFAHVALYHDVFSYHSFNA